MAPRSKPRVKHRSSINSKGLKNKVETRERVFATTGWGSGGGDNAKGGKSRRSSFEINLSGMPCRKLPVKGRDVG